MRWLKRYSLSLAIVGAILVGGFLIFNIGVATEYAKYSEQQHAEQRANTAKAKENGVYAFWQWTTHDPVAFYTSVLALFTFILSVSTIGLWVVTWRGSVRQSSDMEAAINASMKQADAIITAERPYVFLKITEPGVDVNDEGQISFAGKRLRVKFVNYGRTPALIDEVTERYRVVEGLANIPPPLDPAKDRGRLAPIGTVSAGDAPHVFATNLFFSIENGGAAKMLEANAWTMRRMFFYGFVRYRDAFGTHYINGFLAIFSPEGKTWVLRGDERYNYSRTERAEDIPPHPAYN